MILFQELQEVSENSGITFDCAFDEFEVILKLETDQRT